MAAVAILVWAWATGRLAGFRVEREEWRPLVVLGLLFTAQIGLMNVGTDFTTAARSAVILNLYAVHFVVLAHFMIPGDRLTWKRLGGVLVAYAGVIALFGPRAAAAGASLLGDALMFGSALLLAERTVYLARAVRTLDPVKLLLAQVGIGTLLFFLLSSVFEGGATRWTLRLVVSLAYQGVVVAGFNFIVNLWLLRHYRASALAAIFLTQPIFGVVIAALIAGEPLTPALLVASVAVAAGIGLTRR